MIAKSRTVKEARISCTKLFLSSCRALFWTKDQSYRPSLNAFFSSSTRPVPLRSKPLWSVPLGEIWNPVWYLSIPGHSFVTSCYSLDEERSLFSAVAARSLRAHDERRWAARPRIPRQPSGCRSLPWKDPGFEPLPPGYLANLPVLQSSDPKSRRAAAKIDAEALLGRILWSKY